MKPTIHASGKKIIAIFIVGIFLFFTPNLFSQDEPVQVQALKSFRISPKKEADNNFIGAVYNPNLNLYVVFFFDYKYDSNGPHQTVFTQKFTRKGKKAGSIYTLRAAHGTENFMPMMDITLNEKENEILYIWSGSRYDVISGVVLNGEGRIFYEDGSPPIQTIKSSTRALSGFYPQTTWIPSMNQYAVGWTHYDYINPSNLDNGFYLAVLNANLKRKLKPTKVKQQSMKNMNYVVSTLLPLENGLLWGSAQDSAKKFKPVVWFTDLRGEAIVGPNTKRDGSIFPGKKVKGKGFVRADYNPYLGQHLLMWEAADRPAFGEETFRDTFFRIMNSDGSFFFKKRKMPKNFRFHTSARPIFNPVTNNYFVVYAEYKILYQFDPHLNYFGGRLWATYIDNLGNVGLPDESGQDAYPLTDVFNDKDTSMRLLETIYNPVHNEYLVIFELIDISSFANWTSDIWGIIIKAN